MRNIVLKDLGAQDALIEITKEQINVVPDTINGVPLTELVYNSNKDTEIDTSISSPIHKPSIDNVVVYTNGVVIVKALVPTTKYSFMGETSEYTWTTRDTLNNTIIQEVSTKEPLLIIDSSPVGDISVELVVMYDDVISPVSDLVTYTITVQETGLAPIVSTSVTPVPLLGSSFTNTPPVGQLLIDPIIASDWVLLDNVGNVIWESLYDTISVYNINIPSGILTASSSYTLTVANITNTERTPNGVLNFSSVGTVYTNSVNINMPNFPVGINHSSVTKYGAKDIILVGGFSANGIIVGTTPGTGVCKILTVGVNQDGSDSFWSDYFNYPRLAYKIGLCTLQDGRVFGVGGNSGVTSDSNKAYILDSTGWIPVDPIPITGVFCTCVTLQNGEVLTLVGHDGTLRSNRCFIFNHLNSPGTQWREVAPHPHHTFKSATLLPNGNVYTISEHVYSATGTYLGTLSNLEFTYVASQNTWSLANTFNLSPYTDQPTYRRVVTRKDGILFSTGLQYYRGGFWSTTNTSRILDPVGANSWVTSPELTINCGHRASAVGITEDGKILVVGGQLMYGSYLSGVNVIT